MSELELAPGTLSVDQLLAICARLGLRLSVQQRDDSVSTPRAAATAWEAIGRRARSRSLSIWTDGELASHWTPAGRRPMELNYGNSCETVLRFSVPAFAALLPA